MKRLPPTSPVETKPSPRSAMDSSLSSQDALPLEQQVARLQALLEATRQIHSTIRPDEMLDRTARILMRELEMAGALFLLPAAFTVHSPVWGDMPPAPYAGCLRFPLLSRESHVLAQLVVAPPAYGSLSLYEQEVEVRIPSELGFEKVAMSTAATWPR